MAISDDVRHTESRRARPLFRRNKVTTVLPRASPYPSSDKTGASEFGAQLRIYIGVHGGDIYIYMFLGGEK